MITSRTATVLALALLTPSASIGSETPSPILYASQYTRCFAICEHPSHGEYRWLGPLRTGSRAVNRAADDANAHNQAYPGHSATMECN